MKKKYRYKGYALAGTMMFLLLVLIMWMGVTRQMGTNLRLEKHLQAQKTYYDGSVRALSWALTLSETGYPYTGFASKSYWVPVGEDGDEKYVITYTRKSDYFTLFPFKWLYNYTVTVRPFVAGSDDGIQRAPNTFGS
ncbi:MAG: hypothetical protein WC496_11705 [Phycisphaerae bacterium]|jgi:hypothetical protein